jgi:phage replication-related protein YjqB (UPF0714/DUF867 family)
MQDKYTSFAALEAGEIAGTDYDTSVRERPESGVLIVAPHGGSIEIGTTELASLIAGDEYSLFAFNGLKLRGRNRDLHITSHNFDHPECVALAARHDVVVAIHGCKGDSSRVYVGGLDDELTTLLTERLEAAGLPASATGHKYPGRNPLNICNRGARGRGAQLEFTLDLRAKPASRVRIAAVVRSTIAEFAATERRPSGERGNPQRGPATERSAKESPAGATERSAKESPAGAKEPRP